MYPQNTFLGLEIHFFKPSNLLIYPPNLLYLSISFNKLHILLYDYRFLQRRAEKLRFEHFLLSPSGYIISRRSIAAWDPPKQRKSVFIYMQGSCLLLKESWLGGKRERCRRRTSELRTSPTGKTYLFLPVEQKLAFIDCRGIWMNLSVGACFLLSLVIEAMFDFYIFMRISVTKNCIINLKKFLGVNLTMFFI